MVKESSRVDSTCHPSPFPPLQYFIDLVLVIADIESDSRRMNREVTGASNKEYTAWRHWYNLIATPHRPDRVVVKLRIYRGIRILRPRESIKGQKGCKSVDALVLP